MCEMMTVGTMVLCILFRGLARRVTPGACVWRESHAEKVLSSGKNDCADGKLDALESRVRGDEYFLQNRFGETDLVIVL